MRLLIIEDDPPLAEVLAEVLSDEGHEAQFALNGSAGWRLLHEMRELPDVVLLDLMMPGMDGQIFRRKQEADPKLAAIPTLVITGQSVSATSLAALGSLPVMRKPFSLPSLLAAIEELAHTRPGSDVRKTCTCGRSYDESEWKQLDLVSRSANQQETADLEIRSCVCRVALAWRRSVPPAGAAQA
jgi:DNA-binding response OmpR family regulator